MWEFLVLLVIDFIICAIKAIFVMWLWNLTITKIFLTDPIGLWMALGISVLFSLLTDHISSSK